MIQNRKVGALMMAGIAVGAVAACQTPDRQAREEPVTMEIEDLAYTIREQRGRLIRICGQLRGPDERGRWRLIDDRVEPGRSRTDYFHGPARVFLFGCSGAAPRLNANGCITGEVVPRDASVLSPPNGIIAISDAPVNLDWYLRQQCSASE